MENSNRTPLPKHKTRGTVGMVFTCVMHLCQF